MDSGQSVVRDRSEVAEPDGQLQCKFRTALPPVALHRKPAAATRARGATPIRPHRPRPVDETPAEPRLKFSPREMQTLYLVACGRTRKQIAAALEISLHTVDVYRRQLVDKLGVRRVVDLQRHALLSGWLRLTPRPTKAGGAS